MVRMLRCFAGLTAVMVSIAALGCGGDDTGGSTATSSKGESATTTTNSVAAAIPEDIKSKGILTVANDPTYPPFEFVGADGKTFEGLDPDLIHALAEKMGLKVEIVKTSFDGIIPGLAAGKYDVGIGAIADTKERENTVDFVVYLKSGESYFFNSSVEPAKFTGASTDLCGHTIAVLKGSGNAITAREQAKKCASNKLTILEFPDQNTANAALSSGRADVSAAYTPVAAWIVKKSNGEFQLAANPYSAPRPAGIVLPKGSGLAQPLIAGLKELMADGTYGTIFKKWGAGSTMISEPVLNGATS